MGTIPVWLHDFIDKVAEVKDGNDNKRIQLLIDQLKVKFEKEMDDDLNISNALAHIFDFVKETNILIMQNNLLILCLVL